MAEPVQPEGSGEKNKKFFYLPIIPRKCWFGLKPNNLQLMGMKEPHKRVCFVSTETYPCDTTEECVKEIREIQKRNMVFRKWPDIPFNFLIGGDGNIYEGRGWKIRLKDWGNSEFEETLHVGYIGEFKDCDPPKQMVDLGAKLVEYGVLRNFIAEDYEYQSCPLDLYYTFPNQGVEAYYESPEYKAFLLTVPQQNTPPPPSQ